MEYNLTKENIFYNAVIFEGCQEQPIDLDFNLPDYCPDIQKILKCRITPKINSKSISGDRLDIDGTAHIMLLYLDSERKNIRCYEHTSPFSASVNIKSSPVNAIATAAIKTEYINCRAVTSRRIDIHGAFSLCIKVFNRESIDIATDINNDDLQQRKSCINVSNFTGAGQSIFIINETIDIASGSQTAEAILRTEAKALVTDYKSISNKLMLKGDVTVKILYLADIDSGACETMEYTIPFSQVIDTDGITENSVAHINLEILTHNTRIKNDMSGDDTLFEFDAKLCATVFAYDDIEINIIDDVYSTVYELDINYKQINVSKIIDILSETFIDKGEISLGETNISKVIDIWNDNITINYSQDEEGLSIFGKLNVCILAYDSENTPFYAERSADFKHSITKYQLPDNITADMSVKVISLSYRITSDNSMEIKAEIKVVSPLFKTNGYKIVNEISTNQDKERLKDSSTALNLYYADKNERIWDIAKEYCTSVEAIKSENDITDDIIENRCMLLIPM